MHEAYKGEGKTSATQSYAEFQAYVESGLTVTEWMLLGRTERALRVVNRIDNMTYSKVSQYDKAEYLRDAK